MLVMSDDFYINKELLMRRERARWNRILFLHFTELIGLLENFIYRNDWSKFTDDRYRLKLSNNSDLCVSQYSPIVGQLKRRKKIYPVNVPKI